ncbi:C4-dicarboxylate ABC transporter permease [Azoarcus sp. DD4]|uniref:TRAP transporter small permease n=1 Tax=Azoarcus sp. DD4 TaxID=2027405 RepID=UPI00112CCF78|nr:TRAP transporter small permease [Azoarcus sp. DD4]QDF95326.1 C4-dicarboxylate ABC transporter permease [Azoarcus sp. DD4]
MTPEPAGAETPDTADPAPLTIEQVLCGVAMALIVLISLGNVVARYLTSQSFAATEEFSIALLIILSFLGSSTAFAFDRHIRVTFFIECLPPRWRQAAEWLSFVVTAALFGFIAYYAGRLTVDQYRFEETSPALGLPQWWYTAWMPALAVVIVLRLVLTRLGVRK